MPENIDSKQSTTVTVAIINYNGRDVIATTLKSVFESDYPNIEVIMVDDASTDESPSIVERDFPDVKVYRQTKNMGTNAGRRRAIQEASCDIVLLSDNDMIMAPDSLRLLVETMEKCPDVGLATPMILDSEERDKIYSDDVKLHYLGFAIIPLRHHKVPVDFDWSTRRMVVGSGGMMLARKSCILKIDGYDPDYRFGYDDGETSFRVSMAGYKVMYVPRAKIFHKESQPRATGMLRYAIATRWMLMLTCYSARTLIAIAPMMFIFEMAQFAFLTMKKAPGEWFHGLAWVMGNIGRLKEKRREILSVKTVADKDLFVSGEIFIFPYRLNLFIKMAKITVEKIFNGYWWLIRPILTK